MALQPPADLAEDEKRIWWETLGRLRDLDALDVVSPAELADYCRAWVAWNRALDERRPAATIARLSGRWMEFRLRVRKRLDTRAQLGMEPGKRRRRRVRR